MPPEGWGMRQGCAHLRGLSSDSPTHLGEVPALDEVAGDVTRGSAVHHGGDVVPGHPGRGVSVNEVCRTGEHGGTSSDKGHACGKAQHPPPDTEVSETWHQAPPRQMTWTATAKLALKPLKGSFAAFS